MKLRLRVLAWSHVAIGGLGLGAFLILAAAAAGEPAYADEFAWMGGLTGVLSLIYFAPMLAGGIGLLTGKPWARALLWGEAAALALLIPVGTVLAGFSLWALLTTVDLSGDGGMALIEQRVKRMLHALVLILIGLFILGVIIGAGWVFRDVIDPPSRQILTPLPSGVPGRLPEQPDFRMPELPAAPER